MAQSATNLIQLLKENGLKEQLRALYGEEQLEGQTRRYLGILENYVKEFGDEEVEIYSAPGRSEVGGNHTDHQRGQVLAAAVDLDVVAVAHKTDDGIIHVHSEGYEPSIVSVGALEIEKREYGTSKALIRGVAAGFKERGFGIGGFHACMTSNVLGGSGLSSSAAYEVTIGNILSGLYNEMKVDPVDIAVISQYAENHYFGKPCGLMDQMASSVGGLTNIDFENPLDPVIRKLDVDFDTFGHHLCIVDTKGSHADLTPEYAAIPQEMRRVAAFFGKEVLREVSEEELLANLPLIRKEAGDRAVLRALHFAEEHKRAGLEAEALEKGDFDGFLQLVRESGNSSFKYLQNVYASSHPETQGLSLGLAVSEIVLKGKGACRVHGGGFAGTIQAFVPDSLVTKYRGCMEDLFGDGACYVLRVRREGGIKMI